ncbi:MAG: hypothetical protein H7X97_11910, partial [Opitutaceae bacterium]|nr:hypothetical protein [Verrucomicrobiales bacterium]
MMKTKFIYLGLGALILAAITAVLAIARRRQAAALAISALVVASPIGTNAGNITVKGSDTMVNLAQKWAETYMG